MDIQFRDASFHHFPVSELTVLPDEVLGNIVELSSFPTVISKLFLKAFHFQVPSLLKTAKKIIGNERVQFVLQKLPSRAESYDQFKALLLDQRQRLKNINGGAEFLEKLAAERSLLSRFVVYEIEKWIQPKLDESLVQLASVIIGKYTTGNPYFTFHLKFKELELLDADSIRIWMKDHREDLNVIDKIESENTPFSCLPPEIGMMNSIKSIQLIASKLITFAPEIKSLTNLESIFFTNHSKISLPRYLTELPKLSILTLSYCKLERVPKIIFKLSHLKRINLSHNEITFIPKKFEELKS